MEPESNDEYIKNLRNENLKSKINETDDYEEMDETDFGTNNFLMRPKVFCCGDGLNVKQLLGGRSETRGSSGSGIPGQAIQIITDSNGIHTATRENDLKVGDCIIKEIKINEKCLEETINESSEDDSEDRDELTKLKNDDKEFNDDDNFMYKATISDDDGVDLLKRKMKRVNSKSLPSTSSRDNDIIKFVFTDRGIKVISDKEYVV